MEQTPTKNTFPVLALSCLGGTSIQDALPEAIATAKAAGEMVYLIHNVPLRVYPDSTPDELMADWDRKMA